ncbi:MAG: pentapeptide repeat-containing protein [Planctomycetota bacterium]
MSCVIAVGTSGQLVRHYNGQVLEPTFPVAGDTVENRYWIYADLRNAALPGVTWRQINLFVAQAGGANFAGSTFERVNFTFTDFTGADLSGVVFRDLRLEGANLKNANLDGATFDHVSSLTSEMFYSSATGADPARRWSSVDFVDPDFSEWDLRGQNLKQANVSGDWDLRDADLTHATLPESLSAWIEGATLANVDLRGTSIGIEGGFSALQNVDFSGAEITGLSLTKRRFPNGTRLRAPVGLFTPTASYQRGDLRGIGLNDIDLTGWDLSGQDLRGASFSGANLTDVDFTDADIRDTNRRFADGFTVDQLQSTATYRNDQLAGIHLFGMDLSGADFAGKTLDSAILRGTILTEADFTGASIAGVSFQDAVGLTEPQFQSTATYATGNLSNVAFPSDTTGWHLADFELRGGSFNDATDAAFDRADLRGASIEQAPGASFRGADLREARFGPDFTDADFTDARIDQPRLEAGVLTETQLRSTASHRAGAIRGWVADGDFPVGFTALAGLDLRGASWNEVTVIGGDLTETDLSGSILGEQWYIDDATARSLNVQNTYFDLPDFDRADLFGSDFRGATFSGRSDEQQDLSVAADPASIIRSDGSVQRWELEAGEALRLWDTRSSDLPTIAVEAALLLDTDAELRFVFEDEAWGSTLGFEPGATVELSGTLALIVAPDAEPGMSSGTVLKLFDWGGVTPVGTPSIRSEPGFMWDTSAILTEGTVTLLAAAPLGDFSGDGTVDQADLDLVLARWGDAWTPVSWKNRRGLSQGIDLEELDAVLSHWNGSGQPNLRGLVIPEPTAACAMASSTLLLRRRRSIAA